MSDAGHGSKKNQSSGFSAAVSKSRGRVFRYHTFAYGLVMAKLPTFGIGRYSES